MNNLIALILSAGGAAFLTALVTGLLSIRESRMYDKKHSEELIIRRIEQLEVEKSSAPRSSSKEDTTGDYRIRQHIKEKSARRKQEFAEWDRQFKALEPPPVPTGYEEFVIRSADGSVVSTYKVPTYY